MKNVIACNPNVNIIDENGLSPIAQSTINGMSKHIKILAKTKYIDLNHKYSGEYILHIAFENEDFRTFVILLGHGINPNLQDSDGNTVLHLASKSNKDEYLRVLKNTELES